MVFSAHAEVVPRGAAVRLLAIRILRARGGSSQVTLGASRGHLYSPRTRR